MRTYALFGIDKYHRARLLCLVPATTLQEAAGKLACGVKDAGRSTDRDYILHFEPRQECGRLDVRDAPAFHRALAEGCHPDAPGDALDRLVAGYAYGTDNVYREYVIGTVPVAR